MQISRAPDVILHPQSHDQVEKIVVLASKHTVDIVPYGGMAECISFARSSDPGSQAEPTSSEQLKRHLLMQHDPSARLTCGE